MRSTERGPAGCTDGTSNRVEGDVSRSKRTEGRKETGWNAGWKRWFGAERRERTVTKYSVIQKFRVRRKFISNKPYIYMFCKVIAPNILSTCKNGI